MFNQIKFKHIFLYTLSLYLLLFVAGCSFKPPKLFQKEPPPVSNLSPDAIVVDKDSIYNTTLSIIESAQKSIYIEQSEFDDPRIIQMLIDKHKAGVEIRVLLDQWKTANRSTMDILKSKNISIQYYPARKGQYNHAKMLVVDQEKALIYGPSLTENSLKAHDIAVMLSGYSGWKAAQTFAKDWQFTTTLSLNVPKTSSLSSDNIVIATNANVKQQVTEQISGSTKSIWVELTDLSDKDTVQALLDAADKGRDIKILVSKPNVSSTPVTIEKLKAKGIAVRFYDNDQGPNIGIFDDRTFILTSSGWTYSTFVINHELSITVPSPQATAKLKQVFQADWEKATPA